MMAAVPNVRAMETLVAKSDSRNCFNEDIPLPIFRLFGVCSLIFIRLNFFNYLSNGRQSSLPSPLIVMYIDTSQHEPVCQRLLILSQQIDRNLHMLTDHDGLSG